jgi:hypothetical protein
LKVQDLEWDVAQKKNVKTQLLYFRIWVNDDDEI